MLQYKYPGNAETVVQWDTTHKQHMWSLSCFNSAQHKAKLNPSKVESPLLSALAFVLLAFFTLQTSFWRLLYTVNMFKYVWRASENMIIIDNMSVSVGWWEAPPSRLGHFPFLGLPQLPQYLFPPAVRRCRKLTQEWLLDAFARRSIKY